MTVALAPASPPDVQTILGGSISAVFQPVLDFRSGEVFGYEALARSANRRFASPIELFAAASELKIGGPLGRRVREFAVAGCERQPLFLNVHPTELESASLLDPSDPMYSHEGAVFLEISESVPLSKKSRGAEVLAELRRLGVGLAVDDLGAGYSNLRYIADLAPEIVKLDRGLVANLSTDARLRRLVTSIVRLCEDLGAAVVAEGIETLPELRAVRDTGAAFGQGYFIARPSFPPPPLSVESRITFPPPPARLG